MVEVLVEENFAHIDGTDMNVILDTLDGLELEAEPTAPRGDHSGHDWVLVLHWLQQGPVATDTEVALPAAFTAIRAHFTLAGKQPPARMDLFGPDDKILLTLDPSPPAS